jgi:hypothetical protein
MAKKRRGHSIRLLNPMQHLRNNPKTCSAPSAGLIGQTLLKLQVAGTFSLVKRQLLFIASCVVIAVILHRFRRLEDNESARGRFLG